MGNTRTAPILQATVPFSLSSHVKETHQMDQLTPAVSDLNIAPFNPHEIAKLLLSYYELMADMHYIDRTYIKLPPHDPPISTNLAQALNMEPQVIELLHLLPYLEGYGGEDDFMLGGSFADFRDPEQLKRSRDPRYAEWEKTGKDPDEEGGIYVMPWVCVLNDDGHRGSEITIDDQGRCGDPFFQEQNIRIRPGMLPHPKNKNRIEHLPSRPAADLFNDISGKLRSLEWVPFSDGMRILFPPFKDSPHFDEDAPCEYEEVKMMYEAYGWPDQFDGKGFDDAMERYLEFSRVRRDAREPFAKAWMAKRRKEGTEKWLCGHSGRLSEQGIWDNDPNKSEEEVKALEKALISGREEVTRAEQEHVEALRKAGGLQDMSVLMENAWKKYLKEQLEGVRRNYVYYASEEGAKYRKEEEIKKMENKMREMEERLGNVKEEPMSVFEAVGMSVGSDMDWA
ncbi:hypothetical protein G7Y89_g3300 [Cudoniella acicularis]|uniref:Uncharacterized protein n=1 Tax=Cudoniella acicularis TaxID=354080 RepID=A0A8H4RRM9_9HELO|nr:hypothetical protein G7Y89_g3300 [Cudoniella acicularis]